MNEELITSAVSFLQDPTVQLSPVSKKVEFLASKGLNELEIEEAMKRVNNPATTTTNTSTASSNNNANTRSNALPPVDYYNPPTPPERSWKDYFIMATTTVGLSYGLYLIGTKYLLPYIVPPSLTEIEKDKQTIEEEFLKIEKVLEKLEEDQTEIKKSNDSKTQEIDIVIDNVNDFLVKYNKDKLKFDDDLRLMKLEIDNLSNSIEKNMSFTKNNLNEELSQINSELQSLKQLVKIKSSGAIDRKLTPVSSIPKASDILKKAKGVAASAATNADVSRYENKSNGSSANSNIPATTYPDKPPLLGSSSVDNITAAGIPAWQMKHKEKDLGITNSGNTTGTSTPTPALTATDDSAEQKVKDTLKDVGVPAWQLNANQSS